MLNFLLCVLLTIPSKRPAVFRLVVVSVYLLLLFAWLDIHNFTHKNVLLFLSGVVWLSRDVVQLS